MKNPKAHLIHCIKTLLEGLGAEIGSFNADYGVIYFYYKNEKYTLGLKKG